MEIYLENIGKVKQARIKINGITVIAGENDTGKSTIGKALFSMFHGFYHLEEKIHQDKQENLAQLLYRNFSNKVSHKIFKKKYFEQVADALLDFSAENDIFSDAKNETEEIKNFFQGEYAELFSTEEGKNFVSDVLEIIKISNAEIGKSILSQTLNTEFYNQINSLQTKSEGKIELTVKQKKNLVVIQSNKVTQLVENIPLETDVIYLDDPLLLNQVPTIFFSKERYFHSMNHQEWLIWNLQNDLKFPYLDKIMEQSTGNSVTNEILVEKRLKKIYAKLETVCSGNVISKNNMLGEWTYRQGDSEEIFLKNLSTGLKTFVILKFLLQKGKLSFRSTIILDEPEIHVHPEWQLVLAELIVLLNKEFQVHILLNTHSPYFLRAIEVYSRKHGIADKCNYYLSELNVDRAEIKNVTDDTELIYKKLWIPLQKLEDEVFADE